MYSAARTNAMCCNHDDHVCGARAVRDHGCARAYDVRKLASAGDGGDVDVDCADDTSLRSSRAKEVKTHCASSGQGDATAIASTAVAVNSF